MRIIESDVKNFGDYVIHTIEGEEHGLFFRSPIQKVMYDYYYGDAQFSCGAYAEAIKNPIRRIFEILIGNKNIVKNIDEWMEQIDFAGCNINKLCLPVYFKRTFRKTEAHSQNANSNIQKIVSYGYESPFEYCSGSCEIEKTTFFLRTKKKIKETKTGSYHYTYMHILRESLTA